MSELLKKISRVSWILMIALLPISSMPLVAKLLGSDSVASPAILFMLALLVTWFLPRVFRGGRFSNHILPLLLFCLVALIATALSLFYHMPAFKGINQFAPAISSLGTLMIGFFFFVVASSYLETREEVQLTVRVLNWSGLALVGWALLQAFFWYGFNHYPQWMFDFQGMLSARVLYRQRVNAFALEPSWLAHQLNMLYLPLWLACTLKNKSFHRMRFWKFTIENLLLLGGVAVLLLTLSRVGVAAFILVLLLVALVLHGRVVDWLMGYLNKKGGRHISRRAVSGLLILAYFLVIIAVVVAFTRIDPRMANLFSFSFNQDDSLLRFFNELKFGDRVIYWLTGWNIFNAYPFLGVGLGNAGYYFPKYLPAYGWSLVEVENLLNRTTILLNIKSLWLRLLAETGMVGFSLFLGWLVSLLPTLIKKIRSQCSSVSVFGWMGIFVLVALILEGFSIDSFAMPYWWISLGLAVSNVLSSEENPSAVK
jgi:O-antigen ligase